MELALVLALAVSSNTSVAVVPENFVMIISK
jgi:hypothetical protein